MLSVAFLAVSACPLLAQSRRSVWIAKKALSTFDERANQLRRMTTPLAEASTMSNEIAPT